MNLLSVSGISKKNESSYIIRDINFSQKQFQKVAIAGETGSGKSTLLKIIAGLIQPGEGEVLFEQERVLGPDEKLLPGHKDIAYLSQHFELRNNYRVEEFLEMNNNLSNEDAATIYDVCRINHLLKRRTDQLSGGEKQRIATAKTLTSSPKLLLLDEPFSNLDMVHKNMMKAVINDIGDRLRITCTLISHDPGDILSWADEIIVMREGQLLQKGTPEKVYKQPVDEYTAGLLGPYSLMNHSQAGPFVELPANNINSKKLLIRPEQFKVTDEVSGALKGTVNQVKFYGSYYEMEVLLQNNIVLVKTDTFNFSTTNVVYLSLNDGHLWYV